MRINELELLGLGTAEGDSLFVRLHTDAGLVGVGESPLAGQAAATALPLYLRTIAAPVVIGGDPFATEALVGRLLDRGSAGLDELVAGAAAVLEVACWDLVGKALDVPVYRLLGGAVRDSIPAYASGWPPADPSPEALASAVRRTLALGYRALAFDPFAGTGRHEPSREAVRAAARRAEVVRAAAGPDVEILIELGGRFTPAAASRIARALDRVDPAWIADPLAADQARTLAAFGRRVRVPIAAGGSRRHRADFLEILTPRACEVIQPDLARSCGFLETRKIAALAESHAISLALRQGGGPVAAAASLHLAATLTNVLMIEARGDFAATEAFGAGPSGGRSGSLARESAVGCPEPVQGCFPLPQGPGLGVTLNDDLIRAHPPRNAVLAAFLRG